MKGCYAASLRLELDGFHFVHLFQDEEQLAIRSTRRAVQNLGLACKVRESEAESIIQKILFVVYLLLILLPRLAVGRIGEHKAEGLVGEMILSNGVAQMDARGVNAFDDGVGFTNGIGLRVDFCSRELDGVGADSQADEIFTTFSKHTTRTAGRIV